MRVTEAIRCKSGRLGVQEQRGQFGGGQLRRLRPKTGHSSGFSSGSLAQTTPVSTGISPASQAEDVRASTSLDRLQRSLARAKSVSVRPCSSPERQHLTSAHPTWGDPPLLRLASTLLGFAWKTALEGGTHSVHHSCSLFYLILTQSATWLGGPMKSGVRLSEAERGHSGTKSTRAQETLPKLVHRTAWHIGEKSLDNAGDEGFLTGVI